MSKFYDVFISYRRSDGTGLANALYQYLEAKGLHVFLDRQEMVDGQYFTEQIRDNVIGAPFYILCATQDVFDFREGEDWVAEEMRLAVTEYEKDKESRILLPVVPAGVRVPDESSFPDGTYGAVRANGLYLHGVLPEKEELARILSALSQVNRANLWYAGRRWLEKGKRPGGRFAGLRIDETIMPRAGSKSEYREMPVYVTENGENREELPLFDALEKTDKHVYLIGQGGIGKTTALINIMNRAYEVKRYAANAQIPLFVELSRAPDTYGVLYGRGESTFIRRAIYRQIRADKKVKQVFDSAVDQLDEAFMLDPAIAVVPIDDLLTRQTGAPEFLLLLDGLNEVSRVELPEADGRSIVFMIIQEIKWILKYCPNVRVILTGRTDETDINDEFITKLYLSGVEDGTIRSFLTESGLSEERTKQVFINKGLLKTLRIPLFLTMYASIEDGSDVSTQGEILRKFFHERSGNISGYTLQNRADAVYNDVRTAASASQSMRLSPETQHFILDFLLPEIAFEMERYGQFYLKPRRIKKIILPVLTDTDDTSVCGDFGQEVFDEYRAFGKNTRSVAKAFFRQFEEDENAVLDAVIECCVDSLGILQENDDGYGFMHHHIRDYYAAVRNVHSLRLAVYAFRENERQTALDCLSYLREEPIHAEVRRFIGEFLHENQNRTIDDGEGYAHYSVPEKPCDRNLLKRTLDIFRNRFDGKDGYSVYSLIRILIDVRKDLCGEDLRNLDLRNCTLNGVDLGRKGCGADLSGALLNNENLMPFGHTDGVNCAVYSPDGRFIVSASSDNTVKVWDSRTFQCAATLEGHENSVSSAAFSPDGRYIASASYDKTVKVWDVSTFQCVATLKDHSYSVCSVSFSPDGRYFVSASLDKTVRIWDGVTFRCLKTLNGHTNGVLSASFSPDCRYIVSTSLDKTIKIWDVSSYQCVATMAEHTNGVSNASFSPDGRRIVSASVDRMIKVWDSSTFQCIATIDGHANGVNEVSYSPDGRYIVSASYDKTVKVWDSGSYQCIATMEGHTNGVNSVSCSPDGRYIVSASYDKTVNVWDNAAFQCVATLEGCVNGVNSVSYSPDGRVLVSASRDGTVRVWESGTFRCAATLKGHTDRVNCASYSPDGRYIVSASNDCTVMIWDGGTYRHVSTLRGHTERVVSVSCSPDGRYIASSSNDRTVMIWDRNTFQRVKTLDGHTRRVNSVIFSPDGRNIISASGDRTVRIWDSSSFQCTSMLERHTVGFNDASYSPDGRYIVSASDDGSIRVWDSTTYQCEATPEGHSYAVNSVSYRPDGRYIVSASDDGTVRIWDRGTFHCTATLKGHDICVNSASYSPDGQYIADASNDGTIVLWNADPSADKTDRIAARIENIPGLFVQGCTMRLLHPLSRLSDHSRQLLAQYGADLE